MLFCESLSFCILWYVLNVWTRSELFVKISLVLYAKIASRKHITIEINKIIICHTCYIISHYSVGLRVLIRLYSLVMSAVHVAYVVSKYRRGKSLIFKIIKKLFVYFHHHRTYGFIKLCQRSGTVIDHFIIVDLGLLQRLEMFVVKLYIRLP